MAYYCYTNIVAFYALDNLMNTNLSPSRSQSWADPVAFTRESSTSFISRRFLRSFGQLLLKIRLVAFFIWIWALSRETSSQAQVEGGIHSGSRQVMIVMLDQTRPGGCMMICICIYIYMYIYIWKYTYMYIYIYTIRVNPWRTILRHVCSHVSGVVSRAEKQEAGKHTGKRIVTGSLMFVPWCHRCLLFVAGAAFGEALLPFFVAGAAFCEASEPRKLENAL